VREQALTKLESGGWTKISEAFDKLEKIIKNKFSGSSAELVGSIAKI